MGEHTTFRPGKHWGCGMCGATHQGEPTKIKAYEFEDWYPEPAYVEVPDHAFGAQLHEIVGKFVVESCDPVTRVQCDGENGNGCGLVDEIDIEEFENAWECNSCNSIFDTEPEAEECCQYYRTRTSDMDRYRREQEELELERAKQLLQEKGYAISQPDYPPRPVAIDNIRVNAPSVRPYENY